MTDLFISYSRRDVDFVRWLHDQLKGRGRNVWIDLEDIPPTAQWLEEIYDGIENTNAFVFVISPDSAISEVCKLEIEYAVRQGKKLVPILHRTVEPRDQLHPSLASHNWLFFRQEDNFDQAFDQLIAALDTDLDYIRMHTRLLVRAREWEDRDKDSSFLLRGTDLLGAENWLSSSISKQPRATGLHQAHIFASRKAEINRQRTRLIAVTAALIVSIMLAVIAFIQWREADAARQRASQAQGTAVAALISVNDTRATAQVQEDTFRATIRALGQEAQLVRDTQAESDAADDLGEAPSALSAEIAPSAIPSTSLPQAARSTAVNLLTSLASYRSAQTSEAQLAAQSNLVFYLQNSGDPYPRVLNGHNGAVLAVAFSPDGQRLVSAGEDNTIIIWNTGTWQRIGLPLYGHEAGITSLGYSPDGRFIVSGSRDGSVLLWDATTGEIVRSFSPYAPGVDSATQRLGVSGGAWVLTVAFSPDGATLLSGGADATLNLWNVESGALLRRFNDLPSTIYSVAFSPDSQLAAAAGDDGSVTVWDVASGAEVRRIYAHMGAAFSIDFSPDGRYLASGGADNQAAVWDIETGDAVYTLTGAANVVLSVAFSPDGQFLATSTAENLVRLWDVATGSLVGDAFKAYGDWVYHVAFNPAGSRLATGSSDGRVVILPVGIEAWTQAACDIAGRLLSPGEWEAASPGPSYEEICPAA